MDMDQNEIGPKSFLGKIIHYIRLKFGWKYCSNCGKFVKPRFHKLVIYHPEEPPLFAYYSCPECGIKGDVLSSSIVDDVAQEHGYKDGLDWLEKMDDKFRNKHVEGGDK